MEWLGGLGIAAFLFFTIKGLLWLVIPTLGVVVAKKRLAARHAIAAEPTEFSEPEEA